MFPRAHPDDVATAAEDAVLALLRRPETFDPARGRLPPFLRRAARCDLINLLDEEERHRRGRIPWAAVELTHPDRGAAPVHYFAALRSLLSTSPWMRSIFHAPHPPHRHAAF